MEALKEILTKSSVKKARLAKHKTMFREVRGRVIICKRKINPAPRPRGAPIPPTPTSGTGGGTSPVSTPPTSTTGNTGQPPGTVSAPGSSNPDPAGTLRPLEKNLVLLAITRLSYGPAAGDFDRITKMGFDAWLTEQLSPNQIDDSALVG